MTMQDDTPLADEEVRINSQRTRVDLSSTANASGYALFMNIPRAPLAISARYVRPPLGPDVMVDLGTFDHRIGLSSFLFRDASSTTLLRLNLLEIPAASYDLGCAILCQGAILLVRWQWRPHSSDPEFVDKREGRCDRFHHSRAVSGELGIYLAPVGEGRDATKLIAISARSDE
jgi:hypothetical protein